MRILYYLLSLKIMVCKKLRVLQFTFFIGADYGFLRQGKTIMKAKWQGGAHKSLMKLAVTLWVVRWP
jgi:hypothetical protein